MSHAELLLKICVLCFGTHLYALVCSLSPPPQACVDSVYPIFSTFVLPVGILTHQIDAASVKFKCMYVCECKPLLHCKFEGKFYL